MIAWRAISLLSSFISWLDSTASFNFNMNGTIQQALGMKVDERILESKFVLSEVDR
jgi:hypothetical protein